MVSTVILAGRPVHRVGFGAMQLPGPGVFGPPRDRDAALAVLRRAVELGCLLSVNRSMDAARLRAAGVPLSSLLPETDHPSGNRGSDEPRQPGRTLDVELALASVYGTTPEAVRQEFWHTLVAQVDALGVLSLLPRVVQAMLAQARAT